MRARTLLPWLAALMLGGCDIGDRNPQVVPDSAPPPDASPPDAEPVQLCRNSTPTQADGHHHPGLNCMAGNCHGPAGDAPELTIAGTLFTTANGPDVVPRATITIVDANGTVFDLVTALNGNFYTAAPVVAPYKVLASKCPQIAPMVSAVQYGSCNGCHVAGSTTGQVFLQ